MVTGLVFSGGGIRGVAHIGAIKALEEHDIYPDHIAGTSAGAIVGALYAAGISWEAILDFFKSTQLFSIANFAINKPGFVYAEKFYDSFLAYLPTDDFKALKTPLQITATNILDGTLRVFCDGELIRPVLASAAFPGVFAPVKIEDAHYVDGGILNNFPTDLLRERCDRLIGVYANSFEKIELKELKHFYSILERAFKIKAAKESIPKFKDCDLIICPQGLSKYGIFALRDIDTIFMLGYKTAKEQIKKSTLFQHKP